MNTLLIKNARVVATMDDARTELADASVLMRGNVIEAVGPAGQLPALADEVINARRHVVVPGLINTHHHMFQTLTRAVPGAQDAELFAWLKVLYPVWSGLTPEMLEVSTQVAMAELLLSGCTTSSDHLYLFPNGCTLDHSIEAATRIGMRFHATRGAMSVGESMGGLPPDRLVEKEAAILKDTQRLIERWHDPARHAMTRIAAAPCSPFSVSRDLMRESAALARSYGRDHGVRLHTHLAENDNDVAYSREKFGMTPAEYAEDCGWLGDDVWHAHCVKLDAPGIARFGATGTGVASGKCAANTGNQRHSLAMCEIADSTRGNRTARSDPSRKIALSVPLDSTRVNANSHQCGNWSSIRLRTNATGISRSSACILVMVSPK